MYDRALIDYLPSVLGDVREFQALTNAEDIEISELWGKVQNALNDQFVLSATENGVRRLEKILSIVPKGTFTLDERKFTILARMVEQLPYTLRKLREILGELCGANGFKIQLDTEAPMLLVQVALTAVNNFDDVDRMLKRVIPANLLIDLTIEFNQHFKLKPFTHSELSAKTHYQIRNEVL